MILSLRPRRGSARRRMSCGATLLLSGCAALDPATDVKTAAALSASRTQAPVHAAWSEPIGLRSTAWDGVSMLTADAAFLVALQNNPALRIALTSIAECRADFVQAGLLPNPSIGLGFGIASDGLAGSPAVVQGLQVMNWLWTRPERIALANASLQESVLSAASATVELAAKVAAAHARVLAQQEVVRLERLSVAIATQSRDITAENHAAGELAALDVDRAELDLQKARTRAIASNHELTQAKLLLLSHIGWPSQTTDWEASEPVGVNPPADSNNRALCALATSQRLDLAAAAVAVERATTRCVLAGMKRLPDLTFTFGWQRNFSDRQAVVPGAMLTVPVFDNGDPARAKASAQLESARLAWIALANDIELNVRDAGNQWRQAASQRVLSEGSLVPTAARALRRSQAAYDEGTVGLTVLLLAQDDHIAAQRSLVAYRLAESEALINLRRAVGGTFSKLTHSPSSTNVTEEAS